VPPLAEPAPDVHEKLMALLKRRGYLAPSYEIYGGVAGFFDYGPLGAGLKTNLENLWRSLYVHGEGMAEIQCPTISPEQVFRASGHLEKFADTVVECAQCGGGFRGDHLLKGEFKRFLDGAAAALAKSKAIDAATRSIVLATLTPFYETARASADQDPSPENVTRLMRPKEDRKTEAGPLTGAFSTSRVALAVAGKPVYEATLTCPGCSKAFDEQTKITAFNLMFKTQVGPGSGRAGYLRPETAQGMFMDFTWLYRYFREEMPFGAVQIGKAYRNEISPRQSLLRLREFHQMEAEVFFDPENKTWPRFEALAGRELALLTREAQERGTEDVVRLPMGEAVAKGIIANGALGYFIALTDRFLDLAGVSPAKLRFRQHLSTEKAHYSTDTWDAEFLSPRFGWVEIVGIADRTDYDLKAHARVSGANLLALRRFPSPRDVEVNRVVPNGAKLGPLYKGKAGAVMEAVKALSPDAITPGQPIRVSADGQDYEVPADAYRVERITERLDGESYVPHVVEPSYGIDRIFYAVLEGAYEEKEWATLKLPARVAPIKAGVFPLMAKDGLDVVAKKIDVDLRERGVLSQYDDGGSIGRRYARADEIGVPFCVTVDYDTLSEKSVTIRDRDSAEQKRIPLDAVVDALERLARGRATFADL